MSTNIKIQRSLNLSLNQDWSDAVVGQSFYFEPVKGEGHIMDKSKDYDGI